MLRLVAVAVAVTSIPGCAAYQPGSFTSRRVSFEGQRATVGCLDVAVTRRSDPRVSTVIQYQFANRCDQQALVDLGAVAVVGRTETGDEVALEPIDPRREIKPMALDGRLVGQEALGYDSSEKLTQVCVDLASIGRVTPAQWACFAVGDGGLPISSDAEASRGSIALEVL